MQSLGLKSLTFAMLGHIVSDHGVVVGVLTEASCGRLVEYSDRTAVYEAVAKMQRKGIIHRSLNAGNIFITDDGVRFLGISSVLFFEDEEILQEMAQRWHWDRLVDVFEELKDKPFNDHPWMRKIPAPALPLPRLPSPGRELPPVPDSSKMWFLFSLFLADVIKYDEWLQREAWMSKDRSLVRYRSRKRTSILPHIRSVRHHGKQGVDLLFDEPLASSSPNRPSRVRIELAGPHYPYIFGSSRRTVRDDATVCSDSSCTIVSRSTSPQ